MAGSQTTLLNSLTLGETTDLVRRRFVSLREEYKPVARSLFIVRDIGQGQGDSVRFNEFDFDKYAEDKAQGANFKKAKNGIGYSKDLNAYSIGKEMEFTIEFRNNNRYPELAGKMIDEMSMFCDRRIELDLTHRLTFATSSSYTNMNGNTVDVTVGDGNPLAYATHTLAFSSTTYSNRLSADPVFSEGAYETALLHAATQIFDNFGNKRSMNFNTIVTGEDPTTIRVVRQMLNSTAAVDGLNAGVSNVYSASQTGMKHVILRDLATTASGGVDLTKRKWWAIAATGNDVYGWQAYLGMFASPDLKTPAEGSNGEDVHNRNWTYSTYAQLGIAAVSGKGIIFSCPATASTL